MDRFFNENRRALLIGGAVVAAAAAAAGVIYLASSSSALPEESKDAKSSPTVLPENAASKPDAAAAPPAPAPKPVAAVNAPASSGSIASASAKSSAPAAGGAGSASGGASGGVKLSKKQLVAMYEEMADRLEELQREWEPKAADHLGSEAALAEYHMQVTLALKAVEDDIQGKFKVEQRDVAQATALYANDDDVKACLMRIKTLMMGEESARDVPDHELEEIPVPAGMTADSFYELFDKHLKEVERGFASAVRDAKLQAPAGPDRKDYMQMLVQRRLGEWTARAQEAVGLSEEEFQACMMRFQKDPRFMMRVFDGQKKQTELMETLDEE